MEKNYDKPEDHLKIKEAEKIKQELTFVLDGSYAISSILDMDNLFKEIIHLVIQVTGAERGFLALYNEESEEYDIKAEHNMDTEKIKEHEFALSKNIIDEVKKSLKPVVITDAQESSHFDDKESVIKLGLRSILCVPIAWRNKFMGVIYLDDRNLARLFADRDIELILPLSIQAAISIENARAYRQIEEMNKSLEKNVEQRTHELKEKITELKVFYDTAVDRELKMIESENKLKEVEKRNLELEEKLKQVEKRNLELEEKLKS